VPVKVREWIGPAVATTPAQRLGGFARYPSRVSLPRKGHRVGLRIVLFEACTAFTRVTACTLALSPIRDTHSEGFSYFVTSTAAPVASGWSGCRVGLAPTGKRRLCTAHTPSGHLVGICPGMIARADTKRPSINSATRRPNDLHTPPRSQACVRAARISPADNRSASTHRSTRRLASRAAP
jgi:hypothetical protein